MNEKDKLQTSVSKELIEQTRQQLIPNYNNIDEHVQCHLQSLILQILQNSCRKKTLRQIIRNNDFEEAPLLRSHIWKLLLETMTGDAASWSQTRKQNSELYQALRNKFLPSYVDEEDLLDLIGNNNQFDEELWNQITLDTKRTHSSLNFFQSEITSGKVFISKPTKHCNMLSRILYIWGKTNPNIGYVQGMNEILAPVYYLEFQSLEHCYWDRQSQVFFMFSAFMSFVIDMHIKEMDDCESGIMGRMISLNHLLRVVDGPLWIKMEQEGIFPQYYSFRWLALLLAQEFGLHETMRIWDLLLSYEGNQRFFYLYCLCIAILKVRKKDIMQGDFITSLPLIQKLRDVNIETVIEQGHEIFKQYRKINYEEEYNRIMEAHVKQKQMAEAQESQAKAAHWTYAYLMKNTGTYLSKWTIWRKKQ